MYIFYSVHKLKKKYMTYLFLSLSLEFIVFYQFVNEWK